MSSESPSRSESIGTAMPPAVPLPLEEVQAFVARHLENSPVLLRMAREHGTPFYALDAPAVHRRCRLFLETFREYFSRFEAFYAVKSNHHPGIAGIAVTEGFGLDVSSGEELAMALEAGADRILFSGPGKTDDELRLAVEHRERVTVLLDSRLEHERLCSLAADAGTSLEAGVRLTTDKTGLWRRFGIPCRDLAGFLARRGPVVVTGLQFHTSWNMTPDAQTEFIRRLGRTLSAAAAEDLSRLRFLDIGGGFWPERGEWLLAGSGPGKGEVNQQPVCIPAAQLDRFAGEIRESVTGHIHPHASLAVQAEPGRWISDESMHILLTVVDIKGDGVAVTDGATSMVGWERFETDYCPVINLTRPALNEIPCLIAGSLCTPHDIWGARCFATDIRVGDILCLPCQGAYTWSLRQRFIKPEAVALTMSEDPDSPF